MKFKYRIPFYNFWHGCHNVIRWLPTIYNDEQFDFNSIYRLLYHKFKFMEEYYKGDETTSANSLDVADEIMICKNLALRLSNEDYLHNAFIEHEKQFPDYSKKMCFEKEEGSHYVKFVNNNTKEEKKSYSKWSKHSDYMEKQDTEYLFSEITKRIKNWWD